MQKIIFMLWQGCVVADQLKSITASITNAREELTLRHEEQDYLQTLGTNFKLRWENMILRKEWSNNQNPSGIGVKTDLEPEGIF